MTLLDFTPITAWGFYAAAIPAVFLMGLSKSGFGAGFGALGVPLMGLAVSIPQAAAIFLPLLLVMDLAGMAAFRKELDRALLKRLLPWGLLGIAVGTLLFKFVPAHLVAGIVGLLTLLFLAQRLLFPPRADAPPLHPLWGKVLVTAAGFTSFVAHAGGPPYNAYMLSQRLAPVVFTATTAYFYFFINIVKWGPYAWLGLLDWRNLSTSIVLIPVALAGVALGVKVARVISPTWFYRLVMWGMFLTGCKLVWDGFFK
jgi:uncharacterized protein